MGVIIEFPQTEKHKNATRADELLLEFVEFYTMNDCVERREAFRRLQASIFDYVYRE